ncbi:hypothetical protein [Microvirga arabica]|uniref:hypothetical protein n=1 Tax=Microvirga arabica TaxID=1128671 RepID=UPI001939DA7C|nr:hypothetical protein [Microvirga arabica]MBM1173790.1 hypothetical protein [Microvirga arabica]
MFTDFRDGEDKGNVSILFGVDRLSDLAIRQAGDDAIIWHRAEVMILKHVDGYYLSGSDFIF